DELADLFRVDHLATRMRRNAENLIVLAGAVPGRGWRKPVPMVDVLRGAIGEVEEYTRVTVLPVESAALAGRAVGDVIHLLAAPTASRVGSPPRRHRPGYTSAERWWPTVSRSRSKTAGWVCRSPLSPGPTTSWHIRRSSTCPTPPGWGCSSSVGSPPGTASRC